MQQPRILLPILCLIFGLKAAALPAQDTLVKRNGTITELTILYPNGKVKEIQRLQGNEKHGVQKTFNMAGLTEKLLTFKNGEQTGKFVEYHPNGSIRVEGSAIQGLWEGQVTTMVPSGGLSSIANYKVIEKEGKPASVQHGSYKGYDGSGKLESEGSYELGQRTGPWKSYRNGLLVEEETYLAGKQHGPFTSYQNGVKIRSGNLYEEIEVEGELRRNVQDGKLVNYYPDGKVRSSESYSMGKKHGLAEVYGPNGMLIERSFHVRGEPEGLSEYWDEQGRKTIEIPFKIFVVAGIPKGLKHGVEKRWREGVLSDAASWSEGIENGSRIHYHPNKALGSTMEFVHGNLQGKAYEYHANGKPKAEREYKTMVGPDLKPKAVLVNWCKVFDEEGQLSELSWYDSTGNRIIWQTYLEGMPSKFELDHVFKVTYAPTGALLSYELQKGGQVAAFGRFFYTSGQLRKLTFENPGTNYLGHADFSTDGQVISMYSNAHQNPLNLRPDASLIERMIGATGSQVIEHEFFSDDIKDGDYVIPHANGKPFARMSFKAGLPHGEFLFMDALNGDTLRYLQFQNGYPVGYYVDKFAGLRPTQRGIVEQAGKTWYRQQIRMDGAVYSQRKGLADGSVEVQEYFENGKLKYVANAEHGTGTYYNITGIKHSEYLEIPGPAKRIMYREYYIDTDVCKTLRFYTNNIQDSIQENYFPNGALQNRWEFRDGKRHGKFQSYSEKGLLLMEGQFENDLAEGEWPDYRSGKMEILRYRAGKLEVRPETLAYPCACVDTAYSAGRTGFAPMIKDLLPYPTLLSYLHPSLQPVDSFHYNRIFYTGFQHDGRNGNGFGTMNLMLFREFAVELPSDRQLRLIFTPCTTPGYIDRMQLNVSYSTGLPKATRATFYPDRFALQFQKGPLKSTVPKSPFFRATFGTKGIEFTDGEKLRLALDPASTPCFVPARLRGFLDVQIVSAQPVLFERPQISDPNIQLSAHEVDGFFGLSVGHAEMSFRLPVDGAEIRVKGKSDFMLAGGKFATGEMHFAAKPSDAGTVSIEDEAGKPHTVTLEAIRSLWEKQGFSRLEWVEKPGEGLLKVYFFTE